jgi:hypothetical protein
VATCKHASTAGCSCASRSCACPQHQRQLPPIQARHPRHLLDSRLQLSHVDVVNTHDQPPAACIISKHLSTQPSGITWDMQLILLYNRHVANKTRALTYSVEHCWCNRPGCLFQQQLTKQPTISCCESSCTLVGKQAETHSCCNSNTTVHFTQCCACWCDIHLHMRPAAQLAAAQRRCNFPSTSIQLQSWHQT